MFETCFTFKSSSFFLSIHRNDPNGRNTVLFCVKLQWIVERWQIKIELVLSLPLWFQSQSPVPGGKVDMSSGSYLQYNALKANRPILPKPVQLTVTEAPASPVPGQPASKETLTGHCDACNVSFESRAAARAHVFSPRHLATLRPTNFGQPSALVNKNGGGNSGLPGSQVSLSTTVTSSGAGSKGEIIIELPPSTATSNS